MAERQIQEQLERLRRHVQEGRVPRQILERLERQALELQAIQEHIPNNTEEEEKNNTNRNRTTIKRNGGYHKRKTHRKRKAHRKHKTYRRR